MYLHICSIFDSATQAYGRPIAVPSRGLAVRSFSDEVNRPGADNTMHNHPDDFELHAIGGFDDSTGMLTSIHPECLSRGKDLKS
jgi:hypothetical protein